VVYSLSFDDLGKMEADTPESAYIFQLLNSLLLYEHIPISSAEYALKRSQPG
jgi:hypothetical protein